LLDEEQETRQQLAAIARGERSAFEALYRRFSARVFAFVLQRCDDAALAEEVVIDSLLEVWKQPQAFRGQSKFSTWLLSMARFKMIDRLRSAGRPHEDIDSLAEHLSTGANEPFERLAQTELTQDVRRCLQRLAPTHREVVHLVYFEDQPLAEVAAVQGVPQGTVKTRLFHARQRLAQCLAHLSALVRGVAAPGVAGVAGDGGSCGPNGLKVPGLHTEPSGVSPS
jgi:RNA polymerase sigma-70 factor, ECF subfamily